VDVGAGVDVDAAGQSAHGVGRSVRSKHRQAGSRQARREGSRAVATQMDVQQREQRMRDGAVVAVAVAVAGRTDMRGVPGSRDEG
jgi:hypothetical protein